MDKSFQNKANLCAFPRLGCDNLSLIVEVSHLLWSLTKFGYMKMSKYHPCDELHRDGRFFGNTDWQLLLRSGTS